MKCLELLLNWLSFYGSGLPTKCLLFEYVRAEVTLYLVMSTNISMQYVYIYLKRDKTLQITYFRTYSFIMLQNPSKKECSHGFCTICKY